MNAEHSKELRIVPKTAVPGNDLLQPYFKDPLDRAYVIKNTPTAKLLMMVEGLFRRDLYLTKAALMREEGLCLPSYNAYLVTSTDPLARMHEEAHLRIVRIYPSRLGLLFTDVLGEDRENNNSVAFQRDFVEHTINEGAADFVTIEGVLRYSEDPILRTAAIERRNKLLYKNRQGGTDADYQKWMGSVFGLDERIIQTYEKLHQINNPLMVLGSFQALVRLVSRLSYSTGYNYVAHAMNLLRAHSIPDPEALKLIVSSRPTEAAQLSDPVGFIQALIP